MQDFRFEKKPALLNLLQQKAGRDNDSMLGFETAQAFNCGKGNQSINANGTDDFVILFDRNEVDGPVLNPRGHIVSHDPVICLTQPPIQVALQGTPDGMVVAKRLWYLQPYLLKVSLPFIECLNKIFLHAPLSTLK